MQCDFDTSDTGWSRTRHAILDSQSASAEHRYTVAWPEREDGCDHAIRRAGKIVDEHSQSTDSGRPDPATLLDQANSLFTPEYQPPQPTNQLRKSSCATSTTLQQQIEQCSDLADPLLRARLRRAAAMNGTGTGAAFEQDLNDTQPLPSQVFNDYVSVRMSKDSKGLASGAPHSSMDGHPVEAWHHTYHTGDTGYVDLLGDLTATYDEHEPPAEVQDDESEDELAQTDTQLREELVTSPTHMSPTTPGLAGHKRDARGNILQYSAIRTPAADPTSMFKTTRFKPAVGLSQIFHQTQALSSPPPMTDTTRSDPVFERPSPDFRPGFRSSPAAQSSPVIMRHNALQRAMTDPRNTYVSMRDSQEKRKMMQEDIQRQLDDLEDQDELSPDTGERKAELQRLQAAIAAETSRLFSNRGLSSSVKADRARTSIDLRTPAADRGKAGHAILISDDTPRPVSHADVDADVFDDESDNESRDEFDELSQAIVSVSRSTARKLPRESFDDLRPNSSPVRPSMNGGRQVTRHHQLSQSFPGASYSKPRSSNAENYTPSQHIQVPQSQPTSYSQQDSLFQRPPRPVLVSSMYSQTWISPSQQDFSVSSDTRAQMAAEVGSSIPPAPTLPATDAQVELIPSSPPSSPPAAATPSTSKIDDLMERSQAFGEAENVEASSTARSEEVPLPAHDKASLVQTRRKTLRRMPDTSPYSTAPPPVPNAMTEEDDLQVPSASLPVPPPLQAATTEGQDNLQAPSASPPQPSTNSHKTSAPQSNSTGNFETARENQVSASSNTAPRISTSAQMKVIAAEEVSPRRPTVSPLTSQVQPEPTEQTPRRGPGRPREIPESAPSSQERATSAKTTPRKPVGSAQSSPMQKKVAEQKLRTAGRLRKVKPSVLASKISAKPTTIEVAMPLIAANDEFDNLSTPPQKRPRRTLSTRKSLQELPREQHRMSPPAPDESRNNDEPEETIHQSIELPDSAYHNPDLEEGDPLQQQVDVEAPPSASNPRQNDARRHQIDSPPLPTPKQNMPAPLPTAQQKVPAPQPTPQPEDPLQQQEAISTLPTSPPSRRTNNSIKPVVSASLHRNLVGPSSQWQRRSQRQAEPISYQQARAQAGPIRADSLPRKKAHTSVSTTGPEHFYPQRVLARFKDVRPAGAFWPGTYLGPGSRQDTAKVKLDDGNTIEEYLHLIRALELRPGDTIRAYMDEVANKDLLVRGVKNKVSQALTKKGGVPETDVYGHKTVVVEVKTRSSMPHAGAASTAAQTLEVSISTIYVLNSKWEPFLDRFIRLDVFNYSTGMQTPPLMLSTPGTPTSRSRRRTISVTQAKMQPSTPKMVNKTGLFINMAFAVTLSTRTSTKREGKGEADDEKTALSRLLQRNGGTVLFDNFDALFEHHGSSRPGTETPTSSAGTTNDLILSSSSANLGFVALITDGHSRREKYMQALALDLPCLSIRWIQDSVRQGRALPWDRYLLPAGESLILHSAIRSRVMSRANFDPTSASLKYIVENRPKLLESRTVVMAGGSGRNEERKQAFIFLSRALGIKQIHRVKDISAAKALLAAPEVECDYVHVDNGDLESAAARLAGYAISGKRGKQKSGVTESEGSSGLASSSLSIPVNVGGKDLRVVGDEFVVQTLIWGALVDEE